MSEVVKASERMRGVRQNRTDIEDVVAIELRRRGFHYRRNVKTLPGTPDFANKSRRWAIFVNGCYWHHHTNCSRATIPKTNTPFWLEKFRANRARDARKICALRKLGYRVHVIWGCDLQYAQTKSLNLVE